MSDVTGRGLALVLERLARPYDPERVTAALLGLPNRVARQLVGAVLATSDEAEDLLEAMPAIVRSMAIATTDRAERCMGELRGPVLWAETMSARSASAGDPGLFVCATTTKAYDTDENRVLKAALDAIRRAARNAEHGMDSHADDVVRRARHNGQHSAHLMEHQTLAQVPVVRPTGPGPAAHPRRQPASHLSTRPGAAAASRGAHGRRPPTGVRRRADHRAARPVGRRRRAGRAGHRSPAGAAERPGCHHRRADHVPPSRSRRRCASRPRDHRGRSARDGSPLR